MKLIIGLGNPDQRYIGTRHNVGFATLDALAGSLSATWQDKTRFKALIAEAIISGEKLLLAKPTTYYNNSGEAARALTDYYGIDLQDTLIIHDDIDLPFGTVCTRIGSSSGGNNGLKSINQHIGSDTYRIRIGTWNELNDQIDSSDFVLAKFTKNEQTVLEKDVIPATQDYIDAFLNGTFTPTKCSVTKHTEIDT